MHWPSLLDGIRTENQQKDGSGAIPPSRQIVNGMTIFAVEKMLQRRALRQVSAQGSTDSEKETAVNVKTGGEASENDSTIESSESQETEDEDEDEGEPDKGRYEVIYEDGYIESVYGRDIVYICAFFNTMLEHNTLASGYLPLEPTNILDRLSDGILLCAMANALQPGTVDETAVSLGRMLSYPCGWVHKWQNFNLGLASLQTLGICVGTLEMMWFDKEASTLFPAGVLLQVMRLAILGKVHVNCNDQLLYIFDRSFDEHAVAYIRNLPHDEMLRRWVNYQLKKAGTDLQLKDFTTGLADSLVYGHLLDTVAPADKKASLVSMETIKAENELMLRAAMVVQNAQILGISWIIAPEHIVKAGTVKEPNESVSSQIIYIMNVLSLAQIYSIYPSIDVPEQKFDSEFTESLKSSYQRGSTEEMLVMWLNSFGVSSPVVFLDIDLRNGLTLLQVWDALVPGCVDWHHAEITEAEHSPLCAGKPACLANCVLAMECVRKSGLKVKCSARDVASGESKKTLALLVKMRQFHVMSRFSVTHDRMAADILNKVDKMLVNWINCMVASCGIKFRLSDIDDPNLKITNILGFIGERVLTAKGRCHCTDPVWTSAVDEASGLFRASSAAVATPIVRVSTQDETTAPVPDESPVGGNNQISFILHEHPSSIGVALNYTWLFESVYPVSDAQQERYSQTVITMLRQGGVSAFTNTLGTDTDTVVYKDLLMQLMNA